MSSERMLQVELLNALVRAKAWKLLEARAIELEQTCLTKIFRQGFPPRHKS